MFPGMGVFGRQSRISISAPAHGICSRHLSRTRCKVQSTPSMFGFPIYDKAIVQESLLRRQPYSPRPPPHYPPLGPTNRKLGKTAKGISHHNPNPKLVWNPCPTHHPSDAVAFFLSCPPFPGCLSLENSQEIPSGVYAAAKRQRQSKNFPPPQPPPSFS